MNRPIVYTIAFACADHAAASILMREIRDRFGLLDRDDGTLLVKATSIAAGDLLDMLADTPQDTERAREHLRAALVALGDVA